MIKKCNFSKATFKFLKKIERTLKKENIFIDSYIGRGCCGIVFSLKKSNNVLKINFDPNEVAAFRMLEREDLGNVNILKPIRIFKFGKHKCYGMIMKKMKTLKEKQNPVMFKCLSSSAFTAHANLFVKNKCTFFKLKNFFYDYSKLIKKYYYPRKEVKFNKNRWIDQVLACLVSIRGKCYPDLSVGNVLVLKEKYYLIDFKIQDHKHSINYYNKNIEILNMSR